MREKNNYYFLIKLFDFFIVGNLLSDVCYLLLTNTKDDHQSPHLTIYGFVSATFLRLVYQPTAFSIAASVTSAVFTTTLSFFDFLNLPDTVAIFCNRECR